MAVVMGAILTLNLNYCSAILPCFTMWSSPGTLGVTKMGSHYNVMVASEGMAEI